MSAFANVTETQTSNMMQPKTTRAPFKALTETIQRYFFKQGSSTEDPQVQNPQCLTNHHHHLVCLAAAGLNLLAEGYSDPLCGYQGCTTNPYPGFTDFQGSSSSSLIDGITTASQKPRRSHNATQHENLPQKVDVPSAQVVALSDPEELEDLYVDHERIFNPEAIGAWLEDVDLSVEAASMPSSIASLSDLEDDVSEDVSNVSNVSEDVSETSFSGDSFFDCGSLSDDESVYETATEDFEELTKLPRVKTFQKPVSLLHSMEKSRFKRFKKTLHRKPTVSQFDLLPQKNPFAVLHVEPTFERRRKTTWIPLLTNFSLPEPTSPLPNYRDANPLWDIKTMETGDFNIYHKAF